MGDVPGRAMAAAPEIAMLGGVPEPLDRDPRALLFVDLETTGLAGGAGTYAFLVGCAFFEPHGFRTRQYFLPGYQHERRLLAEVEALVRASASLVSYNGKSFDVPVLETRYQFNRLTPPFDGVPHVDMVHPARRFWRGMAASPGAWPETDSCRLVTLERTLFGVRRLGDVPGYEIPSRYFDFMRSGDASPLEPVLEHNRLDLISLAALTFRAVRLLAGAPGILDQRAREPWRRPPARARGADRIGRSAATATPRIAPTASAVPTRRGRAPTRYARSRFAAAATPGTTRPPVPGRPSPTTAAPRLASVARRSRRWRFTSSIARATSARHGASRSSRWPSASARR